MARFSGPAPKGAAPEPCDKSMIVEQVHADRVLFVRELDPKKFLFVADSAHSADARRSRALRSRT